MPYSYAEYGSKGEGDTIAVTFPFISRDHVYVVVDDVDVSSSLYSWNNDSLIDCLAGFPSGTVTRAERRTPIADTEAEQEGGGVYDYEGANLNDDQLLYIQQEQADAEASREARIVAMESDFESIDDSVAAAAGSASAAATSETNAEGHKDDAEAAAVIAATLIGGTVTEAVRHDIDQGLSGGQQDQGRENIAAASLLDVRGNRIVNPCMQVSQENGDSAGTTNNYFAADQWQVVYSFDGAISFQRVASTTPAGAGYRLRLSITTADAAIAAGQYLSVVQRLEASRMRDFLFGSIDARPGVIRIGVRAPAGTYCVSIVNAANDRSFVAEVTISGGEANTDVVKTLTFAGDTTGTWLTDDVKGWNLFFCVACGANFQGSLGWQSGNIIATANQSNGALSISNVFEIFDVGLKLDPDGTGTYGQFEVPEYGRTLRDCLRYYWKHTSTVIYLLPTVQSGSDTRRRAWITWPVPMRTDPTCSGVAGVGTLSGVSGYIFGGYLDGTSAGAGSEVYLTSITASARM